MMETCRHCQCTYFTSVDQRTLVECPLCREQDIEQQARQAQEKGQEAQQEREVQAEAPRYVQLSIF